jgi:hypothetical protein
VILGIEPMISVHRDDARAEPPRVPRQGAGLDAESRGRIAGGNGDGGIHRRLYDDDGLAAQGRAILLFARRKEGVEIEEQRLDRVVSP